MIPARCPFSKNCCIWILKQVKLLLFVGIFVCYVQQNAKPSSSFSESGFLHFSLFFKPFPSRKIPGSFQISKAKYFLLFLVAQCFQLHLIANSYCKTYCKTCLARPHAGPNVLLWNIRKSMKTKLQRTGIHWHTRFEIDRLNCKAKTKIIP